MVFKQLNETLENSWCLNNSFWSLMVFKQLNTRGSLRNIRKHLRHVCKTNNENENTQEEVYYTKYNIPQDCFSVVLTFTSNLEPSATSKIHIPIRKYFPFEYRVYPATDLIQQE